MNTSPHDAWMSLSSTLERETIQCQEESSKAAWTRAQRLLASTPSKLGQEAGDGSSSLAFSSAIPAAQRR